MQLAIQKAAKILTAEIDIKLEVVHTDAHKRMDRMDESVKSSFDTLGEKLDNIAENTNKILVEQGKQTVKIETNTESISIIKTQQFRVAVVFLVAFVALAIKLMST